MGSSLPPKEANLFKLIAKSYETKQYKKGLKAADQILKKFPEHGETLAMKGLTLNCMDSKAEAYELVRKGLKNDLKSHVCWHVYGLLYRSDREYREAIKCYRNALRIDPENIQILRDLSLLQAQMRDLGGYVETCRTLLTLKPNHRNYWIAFAIAHHLNKEPSKAVDILIAYEGTLEEDYPPDNERYEHSEMLLYKISLLEEAGDLEKALEELNNKLVKIVDKLGAKEIQASLLLKLHRYKEAEKSYVNLLEINSENHRYHEGLKKSLGISVENGTEGVDTVTKLTDLYSDLQRKYPKSVAMKRIPLDFLEIGSFRSAVDEYMRPLLRKGVPSLFSDLKSLYSQPGKAHVLEEILLGYESSLRMNGSFPGSTEQEPPSTLLWTLFLLGQHFDRRHAFDKALQKINEAILHTPTVIDLYLMKGRIFKHAGDALAAAALADEARSMDLADRFLNSECVKRMLQADQVEQAEKTASLFTKDGDQHNNLYDMQCMWYELASGDSYYRQGLLGKALKKYLAVEKHYADMVEDQFDFHTYCIRKMTLRAYVHMLRFQDHLHSHRFFHQAAISAIRCYLRLFDSPPKSAAEEEEAAMRGMAPAEKKKLRQKQRKEAARAKKEAEEKLKEEEAAFSSSNKGGKKGSQPPKTADTDPDGEKLLQVEDPLGEATKYLKLLQDHSSEVLETHLLAFEIYMRKKKYLLALQALKRQLKLGLESPDVHRCIIRFFNDVDNLPPPSTDSGKLVNSVIELERSCFKSIESKTLLQANESFLNMNKDSLRHRAAAAEVLFLLAPEQKSTAVEILESSVCSHSAGGGEIAEGVPSWGLKDCCLVYDIFSNTLKDLDAASRWKSRCADLFPFSTFFNGVKSSATCGSENYTYCRKMQASQPPGPLAANGHLPDFSALKIIS
ncbi:hypothetical protein KP509_35G060100 [Ceratopteris richardii]|uniref:Uncharacterized protein n=2 Tax=Ceratopteris richardii TaxID=49495 RepID=A0A8T2QHR8_CERRI|nr:hypothetical protein KP509_35G060100 [Ceratopteris richardii]